MRDANDTRYHLLLGERDWTPPAGTPPPGTPPPIHLDADLEWDAQRQGVRLRDQVFLFTARTGDYRPRPGDRRGAGRDHHGHWYCIDPASTRIRVTAAQSGQTTDFWPRPELPRDDPPPGAFRPKDATDPRPAALWLDALTVTVDQRLVVAAHDDGPPASAWLLVFDLLDFGPPALLRWPDAVPLRAFDMAPLPGGGLWLLDAVNHRLWRLNRHLCVESCRPQPPAPAPDPPSFRDVVAPASPPAAAPVPAARASQAIKLDSDIDFVAVEALDDDHVLLLARALRERGQAEAPSTIHGFHRDDPAWLAWGSPVTLDLALVLPAGDPPRVAFDERIPVAHDIAVLPKGPGDPASRPRLFAASWAGNQAFQFTLHSTEDGFTLAADSAYIPMRAFTGQGLVVADGAVYYPSAGRWVPLREQHRARHSERGVLETPSFDGREPDCVWHRLMLDARLPHGCAIAVESRAARTLDALALQPWQAEPPLRRRDRGSELAWTCPGGDPREGTWELLFQHPRGRFLQLRLTLRGDGNATPTLRALRVWYPRFSYLERYLPAVYREDPTSASFLERFLANAEGTLTALEDRIAAAQVLFDPRTAPEDSLPWLLGWLGAADEVLPDAARRKLFLLHASRLYRARGTVPGLIMALRLALIPGLTETALLADSQLGGIRIREHFTARARAARTPDAPAPGARDAGRGEFTPTSPEAPPLPGDTADLGFEPTIGADPLDLTRWRAFLRRRHRTPLALQRAHGLPALVEFADLPLPTLPPSTPAAARDLSDFETVVLARARVAHRFSVLLPIDALALRSVAERVITLQKPAHTVFDVRFYDSLFRVGDVRLGLDTLLESGVRPFRPAITGASWIGESHLDADPTIPGLRPGERPILR